MERTIILIGLPDLFTLLPFLLYAETHYRFRYFFSYLKKDEPEIIADAPHRLEPGAPLPLLILAKDSNQFPCRLVSVGLTIRQDSAVVFKKELLDEPIAPKEKFWWKIFEIDVSAWQGWIEADVELTIEQNGQTRIYHNDNHKTSSHKPLKVFVSPAPLPRFPHIHYGDAHTHSNYTEDQVEFGAPIEASREPCKAMGLSWFCVTDHSYDLDDRLDSYLQNDPEVPKWKLLHAEISTLNAGSPDFAVVRGEEVTCRTIHGKNVHLLLYGEPKFFPGSGDGAEKWLRTWSEHSIEEMLEQKNEHSVAYAAHPKEPVPFLQRLLLGRGNWTPKDIARDGLSGLQFLNGITDEGFKRGYRRWVQSLLQGKRVFALAGNDAHGNFNRFRQIGIPFFTIRETAHQIFGKMKTGVLLDGTISEEKVLEALRNGRSLITDGPVVLTSLKNEKEAIATFGERIVGKDLELSVSVKSSEEFGNIHSFKVLLGETGASEETILLQQERNLGFDLSESFRIHPANACYIRVEATTSQNNLFDRRPHFCFTNPIWINPRG